MYAPPKKTEPQKASSTKTSDEVPNAVSPEHVQRKTNASGQGFDAQQASLSPSEHGFHDQQEALAPVQMRDGGNKTAGIHKAAQEGTAGSGGSLPHLDKIQASFGAHDVSGVQAYTGGAAQKANKAMGANAYATGNKVAFSGSASLHTAAHEAAHVVQQRAGVSLAGGVGQVGDSYEKHADAVADAVVSGKSAEPLLDKMAGSGQTAVQKSANQPVQRKYEGPPLAPGFYEMFADFPWICGEARVEVTRDDGTTVYGRHRGQSFSVARAHVHSAELLQATGTPDMHQGPSMRAAPPERGQPEYNGPKATDISRAIGILNVEVRTTINILKHAGDVKALQQAQSLSQWLTRANTFATTSRAAALAKKAGPWITAAVSLINLADAWQRGDKAGMFDAVANGAVHVAMGLHPFTAVLDGVLTLIIGPDWPSKTLRGLAACIEESNRRQYDAMIRRSTRPDGTLGPDPTPWVGHPGKF